MKLCGCPNTNWCPVHGLNAHVPPKLTLRKPHAPCDGMSGALGGAEVMRVELS